MPHFQLLMTSRTGEYMAYAEAETPEAAKAQVEEGGYTASEVTERDRALGYTVVAGDFIYGAGPDLATAKREFRNRGGRLSDGYTVLTFDDETDFLGIDQMGRTRTVRKDYDWHKQSNSPTTRIVKPKVGA
jgi:hypothetical protein